MVYVMVLQPRGRVIQASFVATIRSVSRCAGNVIERTTVGTCPMRKIVVSTVGTVRLFTDALCSLCYAHWSCLSYFQLLCKLFWYVLLYVIKLEWYGMSAKFTVDNCWNFGFPTIYNWPHSTRIFSPFLNESKSLHRFKSFPFEMVQFD